MLKQREIKFKAWDFVNKKMHDVGDIYEQSLFNRCGEFVYGEVVFLQYTKLQDKNGKEIYEGDVIESKNERKGEYRKGVVVFEAENVCQSGFNFGSVGWYQDEIEVIGNIYENPELLEKTEDE
jgi:uncharacterized phage protein (TIGR01671 family)